MLYRYIVLCGLVLALCACAKTEQASDQPLKSLAEYEFEDRSRVCLEQTDAFLSDETQHARSAYFSSCMERAGYTRAQYGNVWVR